MTVKWPVDTWVALERWARRNAAGALWRWARPRIRCRLSSAVWSAGLQQAAYESSCQEALALASSCTRFSCVWMMADVAARVAG